MKREEAATDRIHLNGQDRTNERLRLFLALRLPADVLDEVERWQREQLRRCRVVPREHLHVTLAFLGHRPASELELGRWNAARSGGRGGGNPARARPLSRDAERRHARSRRRRRAALALLAADVQERLERLGVYRREGRAWLPHLTVARFRERPRLRPGAAADGNVRSVRRGCLSVTAATGRGAVRSLGIGRTLGGEIGGQARSTRRGARPDRAPVRQGLGHEDERPRGGLGRRASPQARSRSISRSGSAACRAAGSSRSSARSPRARRPSSTT